MRVYKLIMMESKRMNCNQTINKKKSLRNKMKANWKICGKFVQYKMPKEIFLLAEFAFSIKHNTDVNFISIMGILSLIVALNAIPLPPNYF